MPLNLINNLDNFIGKNDIKENIQVYINSCIKDHHSFEHSLIYGLPGTGKTTLAKIIANELHVKLRIVQGATIQKPIDVINILLSMQESEILFVDEIHAVNIKCLELFYSAMEENSLDLNIGKDFNCKLTRIKLPNFSIIAATTIYGKLPQPLIDRFGIIINLNEYSENEIKNIAIFYANKYGVKLDNQDIDLICLASKGIPRITYKLIRRIYDFKISDAKIKVKDILSKIGFVYNEFDKNDYLYLKTLSQNDDDTLGIKTLSQIIGIDELTITLKIEPYLLRKNYIVKTNKGRRITYDGKIILKEISKNV